MQSVKAREAADTIFKVFSMTQLRIKPNLPCFAGERKATKLAIVNCLLCEYWCLVTAGVL